MVLEKKVMADSFSCSFILYSKPTWGPTATAEEQGIYFPENSEGRV